MNGAVDAVVTASAGKIEIRTLDASALSSWNDYVESHAEATFFHLAQWREIIEKVFGHATHYLYASDGNTVRGVLPLAHMKSLFFGNTLTSLPFCVYGGVIADAQRIAELLEAHAVRLAEELRVDHLELRNRERRRPDWPTKELYVTFRKALLPAVDDNMKAIPRKQRAMVRKGVEAGLCSVIDADEDRFFSIYAESVRNLGTPIFTRRYFRALKQVFAERCEVLTVTTAAGEAISSVMSFYFRDEVLPYYGGGKPAARQFKAFDFMYWELMRRACERGVRHFDYGRSKLGTGSYSFKKNWGFEPQPLPYQYHLVRAHQLPDVNPLNPKYRLLIEMWKRLPLPMANSLGPLLARGLG